MLEAGLRSMIARGGIEEERGRGYGRRGRASGIYMQWFYFTLQGGLGSDEVSNSTPATSFTKFKAACWTLGG